MATRASSQSGAKRAHELSSQSPTNESSGLTPCMRSMEMKQDELGSPRKTPKLGAAADCKQDSSGQMPTPLTLPAGSARAEEADDDSMEEEGFECEVCGRVFDDEDEAEAHEANCKVKQEEIVELHRRNNKEKHRPTQPRPPNIELFSETAAPAEEEESEDGWDRVQKAQPRKKKEDGDERPNTPEDAYVDHDWSDDDGCDYETYNQAKSGGNVKGKHNNTFKAAQSRNMQIAKRDAQRGYSK